MLIYEKETESIINCAIEVHNDLGCGLLEKPYENALVVEFKQREIPYSQQKRHNVVYKSEIVGEYKPDLIVFEKIILEIKAINKISDIERAQLLNYLKITGLRLGLILNFKNTRLHWERLII
ncbi:MAG: GxxExxY protein [Planctomycetia bacterium]|nr:GxxExxY protein [Planctomycetia bacterium]